MDDTFDLDAFLQFTQSLDPAQQQQMAQEMEHILGSDFEADAAPIPVVPAMIVPSQNIPANPGVAVTPRAGLTPQAALHIMQPPGMPPTPRPTPAQHPHIPADVRIPTTPHQFHPPQQPRTPARPAVYMEEPVSPLAQEMADSPPKCAPRIDSLAPDTPTRNLFGKENKTPAVSKRKKQSGVHRGWGHEEPGGEGPGVAGDREQGQDRNGVEARMRSAPNNSDSDNDVDDGTKGKQKRARWPRNHKTQLFEAILGADSDLFEKHAVNPQRVYKKVHKRLFAKLYSVKAVEGQFVRSLATYKLLVELLKHTGGGGDPDLIDGEDSDEDSDDGDDGNDVRKRRLQHVKESLQHARTKGADVGKLTEKVADEWLTSTWFDLFHDRYATTPKAGRLHKYGSAVPVSDGPVVVSDAEEEVLTRRKRKKAPPAGVSDESEDERARPAKKPATTSTPGAGARHVVSEPKHTKAKTLHDEGARSISGLGAAIASKVEFDKEKLALAQDTAAARLRLETRRDDRADQRTQVEDARNERLDGLAERELRLKEDAQKIRNKTELANAVLQNPGASAELKAKAHEVMFALLDG